MFAAETHEESLSQEWVERKGENGVFQDGGAPGPPRDRDLGELVRQVSGLAGGGSEGCREMRLKKRAGEGWGTLSATAEGLGLALGARGSHREPPRALSRDAVSSDVLYV